MSTRPVTSYMQVARELRGHALFGAVFQGTPADMGIDFTGEHSEVSGRPLVLLFKPKEIFGRKGNALWTGDEMVKCWDLRDMQQMIWCKHPWGTMILPFTVLSIIIHILINPYHNYEHTLALLYRCFACYPPLPLNPCFAVDICTSILPAPRSGTGMLNLLASSLWRLVALINVSQSFRAIALCHRQCH